MTPPSDFTPALAFGPDLLARAAAVRVLLLDVDGVLTDGGLWWGEHGEAIKRFHTLDGHGLRLLSAAGVRPVVVSGRDSAALRHRLQTLNMLAHARLGDANKLPLAQQVLDELGVSWNQVAAVGDDWPDAPLLRRAALACAPPQAHAEVLSLAHHVTRAGAGQGAVREVCDLLLQARGHYAAFWREASA